MSAQVVVVGGAVGRGRGMGRGRRRCWDGICRMAAGMRRCMLDGRTGWGGAGGDSICGERWCRGLLDVASARAAGMCRPATGTLGRASSMGGVGKSVSSGVG